MPARICSLAFAAVLLAQSATAHMIMASPVPFSIDKLDNSPLSSGDFPCKQKIGFTVSTMNTMAVGDVQPLTFKGTAVHGGGSCQLAVTLDTEPTSSSTFKVIKSIEGACPGLDGTASSFEFSIPSEVPSGQATFAWTWFSKLSGAPEMYMNCAPITVTGGASDTTAFEALPDMFVANIPEASCTSPQNFDTKFPNPGSVVEVAASANLQDPTGSSCGAASGNTGGSASSAVSGATSVASSAAPVPTTLAPSSAAGGVFAPGASSADKASSSSIVASTATLTTLLTVTAAPSLVASSAAPVASSPSPASTGTGTTLNGTSCSPDGAVICNGSTQFGLCNFGQVVWQDVAAGTTCSNGVISRRRSARRQLNHKRSPHSHPF